MGNVLTGLGVFGLAIVATAGLAYCNATMNEHKEEDHSYIAPPATATVSKQDTSSRCTISLASISPSTQQTWSVGSKQSCFVALGIDVGEYGIDNTWGPDTAKAAKEFAEKYTNNQLSSNAACSCLNAALSYETGTSYQYGSPTPTEFQPNYNGDWAKTCPNGNCFGQTSPNTGAPKTNYVHGYDRKDGTHVGGYYRSHK